jgi:hypothetical protein
MAANSFFLAALLRKALSYYLSEVMSGDDAKN